MDTSKVTFDQVLEAVKADDCLGFCLGCGVQADGVEPDARNYECDECGALEVYGAEELMIMMA